MSDPRFARLKTDPRFRKPRKKTQKVVVDERFKSIFEKSSKKGDVKGTKVDKYGRKLSVNHESDNLRRFYRLEGEEEEPQISAAPDYARGEGLVESSDEDLVHDSESDDGSVILGRDIHKPIRIPRDEPEIDLDESQFPELDALAKNNAEKAKEEEEQGVSVGGEQTNRLAVVNLDWDHVKVSHLFKIFSSVVSQSVSREREKGNPKAVKGKVINVRIYPSKFGKERLERERLEGPPKELFKNHNREDDAEDKLDIVEEDDGNEYDEEALREYQLERLRYYYAIVTCNTVDAAAHIYSELDGTELERSANLFNLSFVPDGMTFEDEFTAEATCDVSGNYKGIDFVTDALRHSKVKLTWDDDDPERNKITRRTLSRKEIEESDFKAYLASSGSSDESSDVEDPSTDKRDKMRALLLGNADDNELLPEGWGKSFDKAGEMEITFTPGLSGTKDKTEGGENETTLQRYLRKQKERRKTKKTAKASGDQSEKDKDEDGFFGEDSEDNGEAVPAVKEKNGRKGKANHAETQPTPKHVESSAAELELLLASAEPSEGPKHFDMRSVIKAEKTSSRKRGKRDKKKTATKPDEEETQQDFSINIKDERFKALYEDHSFAIDPTNPHFKKTKSMSALLEERAKRQRYKTKPEEFGGQRANEGSGRSLKSLVESVKRKSVMADEGGGKRRRV